MKKKSKKKKRSSPVDTSDCDGIVAESKVENDNDPMVRKERSTSRRRRSLSSLFKRSGDEKQRGRTREAKHGRRSQSSDISKSRDRQTDFGSGDELDQSMNVNPRLEPREHLRRMTVREALVDSRVRGKSPHRGTVKLEERILDNKHNSLSTSLPHILDQFPEINGTGATDNSQALLSGTTLPRVRKSKRRGHSEGRQNSQQSIDNQILPLDKRKYLINRDHMNVNFTTNEHQNTPEDHNVEIHSLHTCSNTELPMYSNQPFIQQERSRRDSFAHFLELREMKPPGSSASTLSIGRSSESYSNPDRRRSRLDSIIKDTQLKSKDTSVLENDENDDLPFEATKIKSWLQNSVPSDQPQANNDSVFPEQLNDEHIKQAVNEESKQVSNKQTLCNASSSNVLVPFMTYEGTNRRSSYVSPRRFSRVSRTSEKSNNSTKSDDNNCNQSSDKTDVRLSKPDASSSKYVRRFSSNTEKKKQSTCSRNEIDVDKDLLKTDIKPTNNKSPCVNQNIDKLQDLIASPVVEHVTKDVDKINTNPSPQESNKFELNKIEPKISSGKGAFKALVRKHISGKQTLKVDDSKLKLDLSNESKMNLKVVETTDTKKDIDEDPRIETETTFKPIQDSTVDSTDETRLVDDVFEPNMGKEETNLYNKILTCDNNSTDENFIAKEDLSIALSEPILKDETTGKDIKTEDKCTNEFDAIEIINLEEDIPGATKKSLKKRSKSKSKKSKKENKKAKDKNITEEVTENPEIKVETKERKKKSMKTKKDRQKTSVKNKKENEIETTILDKNKDYTTEENNDKTQETPTSNQEKIDKKKKKSKDESSKLQKKPKGILKKSSGIDLESALSKAIIKAGRTASLSNILDSTENLRTKEKPLQRSRSVFAKRSSSAEEISKIKPQHLEIASETIPQRDDKGDADINKKTHEHKPRLSLAAIVAIRTKISRMKKARQKRKEAEAKNDRDETVPQEVDENELKVDDKESNNDFKDKKLESGETNQAQIFYENEVNDSLGRHDEDKDTEKDIIEIDVDNEVKSLVYEKRIHFQANYCDDIMSEEEQIKRRQRNTRLTSRRESKVRQRQKKVISCCKKFVAFLFSHIGLCSLVVAYCILGGIIFQKLEGEGEMEKNREMKELRIDYTKRIFLLAFEDKLTKGSREIFREKVEEILKNYSLVIYKQTKEAGWDGNDESKEPVQWSLPSSLLYAITVMTTIGYGHVAPKTVYGRIVTIAYAVLGIPLTLLCLTNIGDVMAHGFRMLYGKFFCGVCCILFRPARRKRLDPEKGIPAGEERMVMQEEEKAQEVINVPTSVCLLLMSAYVMLGTLLFCEWEGWDMVTGTYFCFITLSTIGFGDVVPGMSSSNWNTNEKLVICACYLIFGLSLIAMCFNLVQEDVKAKCKWLGQKLGIIDKPVSAV